MCLSLDYLYYMFLNRRVGRKIAVRVSFLSVFSQVVWVGLSHIHFQIGPFPLAKAAV